MRARGNPDPTTALDKMFELAVRLTEAMQRGLGERSLTASRAEVLLVLDREGAMVQRRLSESLRCTPRYVTALIDALEVEGLVERRAHPTDRRATLVSLTERGTEAAARMNVERGEAARWLLGDVPAADLRTFIAVADKVLGRIAAAVPSSGEETARGTQEAAGQVRRRPSRTTREGSAGGKERP